MKTVVAIAGILGSLAFTVALSESPPATDRAYEITLVRSQHQIHIRPCRLTWRPTTA